MLNGKGAKIMEFRMFDIILKKRQGQSLNKEEINYMVKEYTKGNIPDYQISAFLMAVYFKGLDKEETLNLTMAMANSGDIVDLSQIEGIKVDKHSTGGVGDKTTLIIAPIVSYCGGKIAKMSGRGLGHTGGTIDKLESIPGFNVEISEEDFINTVNNLGLCIISQSGNITPADKKLYALRDVTATVDIMPLIASSVMSKKIASGADAVLLDVKTGSGAFMKTLSESKELARQMVDIGKNAGRKTAALITNMDIPLGNAIGNSLEVIEAVDTLKGKGPSDLTRICIEISAYMLYLSHKGDLENCRKIAEKALIDGGAFEKFCQMVKAQGGDESYIKDTDKFKKAEIIYEVKTDKEGFISKMNSEKCGMCSCILGAGRIKKEDKIDYSAGIILNKKPGDKVRKGDILAYLHTNNESVLSQAEDVFKNAVTISDKKPENQPLIYDSIF